MKDRIKQLMDSQNMTQQSFAQFLDISTASLSSIFNGRTRPTLNTVDAIHKKFPNINIDWLMFGTGTMFMDGEESSKPLHTPTPPDGGANEPALDFGMDAPVPSPLPSATAQDHRYTPQPSQTAERTVTPVVKYIDKPKRQIIEIKVYFDDSTFETFVPSK